MQTDRGDGVTSIKRRRRDLFSDGIEELTTPFLALGWNLEEIHVTWAHLEKKRTRLRLYTKYLEEPRIQSVETASQGVVKLLVKSYNKRNQVLGAAVWGTVTFRPLFNLGDANPIRTLGDYSRPSHKGYRNTIELPEGNNVDSNQHLKDYLKLVDSLDLDVENRERMRLRLFQLSLHDQASNWLKNLPAGSISTWEDLTTLPRHGIDLWLQVQIFYDHVNPATRRTIDQSAGGKLHEKNAKESWALLEDLALYDNKSWNDPRDFAKLVKAISLPQDVPSTSDHHLIELENQFCSGLHDTQYCMENPEQAFVKYASSRTDEAGDNMISKINLFSKTVSEMLDDTPTRNTTGNPTAQINFASTNYPTKEELRGKGIKIPSKLLSPKYMSQSSLAEQNRNPSSPKRVHFVNLIIILNKEDEAKDEGSVKSSVTENKDHEMTFESEEEFEEEIEVETEEEEEDNLERFNTFPTMKELGYHGWLLKNPRPQWVKAKIRTRNLNNVKLHYNWIMSNRLEPRRNPSNPKKIYNFVGRVRGLKVFIGNYTYECDVMVLEDTTSVVDHNLGSVVFGKPFVEATGLVYDMEKGTIMFEKDKEEIVFEMPRKMEMFKHIDFTDIKTDRIPPFVIKSDDDNSEKTHYSDSLH
ncbi:hypothetical protein Tco_0318525 [Tanacetum coccineum]